MSDKASVFDQRSSQDIEIARVSRSLEGLTEPGWAHVSGWTQLTGAPRRVSCVVACRNAAPALHELLPDLSDTLTEMGYPWELLLIDSASSGDTERLLGTWSQIPGFTWVQLARDYAEPIVFRAGMMMARGDAVVLFDLAAAHEVDLIPVLVEKWELGNELVCARPWRDQGTDSVLHWRTAGPQFSAPHLTRLFDASRVLLMDRQLVGRLLQAQG